MKLLILLKYVDECADLSHLTMWIRKFWSLRFEVIVIQVDVLFGERLSDYRLIAVAYLGLGQHQTLYTRYLTVNVIT